MTDQFEVELDRVATGGEAVGRLPDGRVVFVRGGLPGERVLIELVEERKRFARARAIDILSASPDRIPPQCAHAASGECGGCDWLHVVPDAQTRLKQELVVEQLQRLGRIAEPAVTAARHPRGRRTTVRCLVTDGRLGYRRRRSSAGFAASSCSAVHPLLEELIRDARFPGAAEVTLRVAPSTGERLAIVDGPMHQVLAPADVQVVPSHSPGDAALHELVGGRRWRISARSFFQTSLEGATALVEAVKRGLTGTTGPVVDLYAGVGLLGGAAAGDQLMTAVEQSPSSVADARHNLGDAVQVVSGRVERWVPEHHDVVIADPSRRGLRKQGAAVIDRTGATRLVLVSCDPASLGRDAAVLSSAGWRFQGAEVIDMFPDTSRIEVVSIFDR